MVVNEILIDKFNLGEDKMLQILDEKGRIIIEPAPKFENKELIQLYEFMVFFRVADEKAFSLQREGRMRTYAQLKGQEAAQVGSSYALRANDWIFPSYRDMGAMVVRGVPLENIYLYWMGNEEGSRFPDNANVYPISIPVGSQIPIGVGFANAIKLKKGKEVTLVYFGDGATSEGDFHEGMNLAGVFKTPTVFFCENNQWAISVPRSKQTASETIAQKASAYGFDGIQVDGNDLFAVYSSVKKAVEKAASGNGPTLIEAYTYRISDHTTADDASRYRNKSETEEWKERDPIKRFKLYLEANGLLDNTIDIKIRNRAEQMVNNAIKIAEETLPPEPEDIFKYTYADMTENLREQLDELNGSLE